ncbi:6222_t:CDS:2, partial [Racocetra fulgida]
VAPLISEDGIPFREATLITDDNVKIRAYVCKPINEEEARKRPTILVLHVRKPTEAGIKIDAQ